MAERISISLDQTAQPLWEKLEEEINNTYDGGRSEFFRDMLMTIADDKTRLEAKKDIIDNRIENMERKIEELEMQKEGIQRKIDELSVDEEEKLHDVDDEQFWENTVEMIMTRDNPRTVEARFNKWFEGRYKRYKNKFDSMSEQRFKRKFLAKAEEKGFDDKVSRLQEA